MSTGSDDDEFSYEGYLLFNEVCRAKPLAETETIPNHTNKAESWLLDILPDYKEGNPRDPGKGYDRMLLRDYINEASVPEDSKRFLETLAAFQFRRQEFDAEKAYVDGEERTVEVPSESQVSVLWSREHEQLDKDLGFMLFRGSESDASKAKSQTQTATGDKLSIQSLTFPHQFLLWMFEKAHNGGELTDNLTIANLTNASVTGEEDFYGGEATINKSDDIKRSEPLLLGLLRNKKLEMLEGDFRLQFEDSEAEDELGSALLRAEIQRNKVHVKASKAGLKNAGSIEKMGLSAHLTNEFAYLHEYWEDLPDDEKYVSPEFIVELIRTCIDRDVNFERQPETVLRTQANKRGDDIADYNLSL
mgnify:CR=1 FL=1